jgi:acyl-CoA synthetase
MGHVGGLTFAVGVPLFTGGSAVVVDRWDAAVAVDSIRTRGVTYSGGTALFAREMLDVVAGDEHPALPLAKGYLCGATPFSAQLAEAVEGLGLQATRAYGMTEVPTVSGSAIFDPADVRLRTDGYVAPGCEIRVLDDGKDVVPGAVGEFVVRGPHRALGYLDVAHTRDGFDDEGWFRTGDLGTLDGDGIVRVTGRLKDIVNRGGEKFATLDIEEALALHPAVFEAAVVPAPHPRYGEQPAAFVHLRTGAGDVDGSELAAFLRSTGLATQKIPEVWRFVDELPRTAAGKVRKYVLTDQLGESQGG